MWIISLDLYNNPVKEAGKYFITMFMVMNSRHKAFRMLCNRKPANNNEVLGKFTQCWTYHSLLYPIWSQTLLRTFESGGAFAPSWEARESK